METRLKGEGIRAVHAADGFLPFPYPGDRDAALERGLEPPSVH